MPLIHGYTPKSIRANVAAEVRRGKSVDVAAAISYEEARKAWRHAHPRRPYPAHLRGGRRKSRRYRHSPVTAGIKQQKIRLPRGLSGKAAMAMLRSRERSGKLKIRDFRGSHYDPRTGILTLT